MVGRSKWGRICDLGPKASPIGISHFLCSHSYSLRNNCKKKIKCRVIALNEELMHQKATFKKEYQGIIRKLPTLEGSE